MRDAMLGLLDHLERAVDSIGITPSVVASGFPTLDQRIGGFVGGRLYVVDGAPAEEKRNLGLAFARNVAKSGNPVLYASTQLPEYKIAEQMVAAEGHISLKNLADGHPDEVEWPQLGGAISRLGNNPLHLAELVRWDVRAFEKLVVATKGRSEACLVIIDGFDALIGTGIAPVAAQVVADPRGLVKWLNVPVLAITKPLCCPRREASPDDLMEKWIEVADAVLIVETRDDTPSEGLTVVLNVASKHHGGATTIPLECERLDVRQRSGPVAMDVPLGF
jgi:replicative DNA helicase